MPKVINIPLQAYLHFGHLQVSKICRIFAPLFTLHMTTNTHILTINDRVVTAKHLVRQLPDSTDKQLLLTLLEDVCDQVFCLQGDMIEMRKQIAELNKMIYQPMLSAQLSYPDKDDYNGVREYVESRKERDPIFRNYCRSHSRPQLCSRLTDEFGWVVDPKSYGRNLQRH